MIKNRKKWLTYIMIVLIPSIVFTLFYGIFRHSFEKNKVENEVRWVASIHQKQIDQFIGETITSLEVLALTLESNVSNLEDLETTLKNISKKDPRYGGLYFLDAKGNVLLGSNDLLKQNKLGQKQYIKKMHITEKTTISEEQETLANNQEVIAIATPAFQNEEINGILVAHLRTDYIINIMKLLTPNINILFENTNGIPIFQTDQKHAVSHDKQQWITIPLERVPWNISVIKNEDKIWNKIILYTLSFFVIFTAICHVVYLILHNISLNRQAKKERIQNEAHKLELVGILASSLAHEIRNPLTGIKGLVQLLSEKYPDPQDQFYFSVIYKEIARINQIVSEFLVLGKPTLDKLESIDLKEVLFDLDPIIHSEANLFNVHYQLKLENDAFIVNGVKDQMKQVILNIAKNALESINGEGELSISLRKKEQYAVLTISDTGIGIPKENLKKIFEPFFTSKESGTGLGLVICRRIIQSFYGYIEITSKVEAGTTVSIKLPLKNNKGCSC
ncbi:PAS domain-containing sensor histidine kinase [Bacillus chungangensis]|uniref:histidine kinase n=1 Tax=Bacillus chungangensis TaxID=587633 RepID=A0ABT9WMV7_9BACI|nr:PAS domain-containing sensor histidine kinase [Bacillus chungangensis]MDQ0174567.1 two-component system, sporulation sensor kinase D [Bacillus chungangensis]